MRREDLRERADALRFFVLERGADISLHYDGAIDSLARPDENCIESDLHEIAHGVCLNFDTHGSWRWRHLTSNVSLTISDLPDEDARMKQEGWTLAAEVLAMQQLGIRAWRYVIEEATYQPWTKRRLVSLVRSSMKTRETLRRSRRVLKMFNEACEMGRERRWAC